MVVIDITRDKYINCLINLNKDIVIYTYRTNPSSQRGTQDNIY